MKKLPALLIALVLPLAGGVSCARIQAKSALRDGNKQYKEENFKRAIEFYDKAVGLDPNFAEAWFYLGSSHQALYRPGKEAPENADHLEKAIQAYNKSLETNQKATENQKKVRLNTLGALTAIYSEDPHRDFATAYKYAQDLVAENPNDIKNLYAMANLFEKFEQIPEAEKTYEQIRKSNPNDPKACGALAAFYNKPLWDGRSKFDQAIDVLLSCAALDPNNAEGYQKVATFYWDKSYRDPMLNDEQKTMYADKGLEAVDKALQIKPDYFEAVIFKGLLYRVKATVETNPRLRQQYLEQAATLQKQGLDLKKQQQAGGEGPLAPPPTQG
jgi:tetratricopeptide (TPR) repeat protein